VNTNSDTGITKTKSLLLHLHVVHTIFVSYQTSASAMDRAK